jgi:thermolysin
MKRGLARISVTASVTALSFIACISAGCSSSQSSGTPAPATGAAGALQAATGVAWIVHEDPTYKTIDFAAPLNGDVPLPAGASAAESVLAFLETNKAIFQMRDPKSELTVESSEVDPDDGRTHVRFDQQVGGVPVEDMVWIATLSAAGELEHMSGEYVPSLDTMALVPAITQGVATTTALADLATKFPSVAPSSILPQAATLVVFAAQGKPTLAWNLQFVIADATHNQTVASYVDAQLGTLVWEGSTDKQAATTLAAQGTLAFAPWNQTDAVNVPVSGSTPATLDAVISSVAVAKGPINIEIKTTANAASSTAIKNTSTTPGQWTDSTMPAGEAVDAQNNAALVMTWYQTALKRLSYDGNGGVVLSIINVNGDNDPDNAYWSDSDHAMHYGDGLPDIGHYPTAASLETVAHELTHGVTSKTSKLTYTDNQSRSLNEAFSDIFETFFMQARGGQDDAHLFTFSEDTDRDGIGFRDLAHPQTNTQLLENTGSTHLDNVSQYDDSVDCHIASTIVSNAFYLMTHGGTHESSGMKIPCGIGWAASLKLFWEIEHYDMRPTEHFDTLALKVLQEAKKEQLPLAAVACSFVATGALSAADATKNWGVTCPAGNDGGAPDAGGSDGGDGGASLVTPMGPLVVCQTGPLVGGGDAGSGGSLTH